MKPQHQVLGFERPLAAARMVLLACLTLLACPLQPGVGASPWTAAFDTADASTGWLLNAWGTSASDLYAVGGRLDGGVIMHTDGTTWQRIEPGLTTPLLHWAYGFSPTDVTVVGSGGTVLHFDGTRWAQQPTPTTQPLWGVWGASPNDLWAVGGDGREPNATLLHFDGAAWAIVTLPPLQKARVGQLLKVWGTGPDDVYVVGQGGVVLHRTGGGWREELVGASDDLFSVWGANGVVVAVGGRSNGIASVWNGTRWKTTALAPVLGLSGVWTRDGKTACIAGQQGTLGQLDLASMTFSPELSGHWDDLHSCFGTDSTLIAVGGNLDAHAANAGTYRGVALHRLSPP